MIRATRFFFKKIEMLYLISSIYHPIKTTMKSNRNQFPTTLRDQMEESDHISEDFQANRISHKWNHAAAATAATANPREIIAQYYDQERRHCPTKAGRAEFKHIETALPRHYAIVAASRQPRQFLSLTQLQHIYGSGAPTQQQTQSKARARVHTLGDITPFTEISEYQRGVVIAHSGLAHILVKKLAGVFCVHSHTRRAALERADIIASLISSALACEYLVGNRYYRNLPTNIATEHGLVGNTENASYTKFTEADVTPAKIQETEEALQALYDANIDRLDHCVRQYERGFVSLETLRTDPDFVRMLSEFWKLNFQTMKARSLSESRIAVAANQPDSSIYCFSAQRLVVCRQIFRGQCRFARLCQYRIAHLFDNSTFSYVSLLRSAKNTQLRLCNDGMTASLLTFAAFEPRMVTAEMVPKLGLDYLSCDVSGAANHVQTRDPVFGPLLVKHRQHIPRANELYTKHPGIWRDRASAKRTTYKPVQAILEESIQTGERCMEKTQRYYGYGGGVAHK